MSLEVVPIVPNVVDGRLVYAAKFLCGTITAHGPDSPLLPGTYKTAINIHNPWQHTVEFEKRAIVTLRQDLKNFERGRLGDPQKDQLEADSGLEVDCLDILRVLLPGITDPFVKGFVLIRPLSSRELLDVVAVYTSSV